MIFELRNILNPEQSLLRFKAQFSNCTMVLSSIDKFTGFYDVNTQTWVLCQFAEGFRLVAAIFPEPSSDNRLCRILFAGHPKREKLLCILQNSSLLLFNLTEKRVELEQANLLAETVAT